MSRDEAIRQSVLERDGQRCQICGKDEALNAHHIRPLGMGGSEEKDVAENMITLCVECHGKIHVGALHIERFTADELIVTDSESRQIPNAQIWFYQRQQTEHLEQVEARIQGLSAIEGDVAKDLWELSEGYSLLDPDAVSFAQYVAARGWSAGKATMAARAFSWVVRHDLAWSTGLIAEKVDVIRRADPEDGQRWLAIAVDMSISDLKRELARVGLRVKSVNWFAIWQSRPRILTRQSVRLVRTRDEDSLRESLEVGEVLIRIGKFVVGLRWDRTKQELFDSEGRTIHYEVWEEETAE